MPGAHQPGALAYTRKPTGQWARRGPGRTRRTVARKLTDKRAEDRRVAARLFETRGYSATSMDDIAAGVKLNKGTLYHYFSGKAAILFDIYSEAQEQVVAAINAVP